MCLASRLLFSWAVELDGCAVTLEMMESAASYGGALVARVAQPLACTTKLHSTARYSMTLCRRQHKQLKRMVEIKTTRNKAAVMITLGANVSRDFGLHQQQQRSRGKRCSAT